MRYYTNKNGGDTCMHVLGNGDVMVGVRGLDIYQVKANRLAGRSCMQGFVSDSRQVEAYSQRLRGRERWLYQLQIDGSDAGSMQEYLTTGNCFVREFSLNQPLSYTIRLDSQVRFHEETGVYGMPKGVFYVNDYPTDRDSYFRVYGVNTQITLSSSEISVVIKGDSRLVVKFGDTAQAVCDESTGEEYNRPCKVTMDTPLSDIIEDYWYVYASYHSPNGGAVSAIEWNLAYIRDLYGASRGLLAAGFHEEARRLLAFYLGVWKKWGYLSTAQSVGTDGAMHIHECDETENPGYLILQAFDYLDATGDKEFFGELFPMLQWALEVQVKHVYHGMLPFSGDETYTACGLLPKIHLEDGSCESTMLLIASAKRMLEYKDNPEISKKVEEARSLFRENFVRDGRLITNNPERAEAPKPPRKKGVCVYCYTYMDGIQPNRYGLYTCPDCAGKTEDISSQKIYQLSCVELMPAYIHSDLLTMEEQRSLYERIARRVLQKQNPAEGDGGKCTGYEYGLVLYGLTVTGSPLRHDLYQLVLDSRDEEGVWAEYYIDVKPTGMRWRIWESGVNLMALLEYGNYERRISSEA